MLESIVVYGSLTLIMVICGCYASRRQYVFEKKNGLFGSRQELDFDYFEVLLPIVLFTFIFGCRFDVGIDQLTYLKWYIEGVPDRKEFLWRYTANVLSGCGVHSAVYFAIWAFVQVFLLYYTIKNYRYLFPYVAFYLIVGKFFLSMMNTIRFSTVACIFLYSTKYIINKQFFKYCLCMLISILIHKTAIVLLVFYPIFKYKTSWFSVRSQIIILVISLLLMFYRETALDICSRIFTFFVDLFNYKSAYGYAFYNPKVGVNLFNQGAKFGRNTGLGEIVTLFVGLIIMINHKKMQKKYESPLFNISYTLWFISFAFGLIAGKSFVLGRPLLYLEPFKLLTLAYFTHYCFSSKKFTKQAMGAFFILLYMVLFINIISMGEVNKSAFTFFWQH